MANFCLPFDKTETNLTKMSHVKHSHEMLLNLNALRNDDNLCDGEIILSDGKINVQCNVIAAGSPYFRALFKFEDNKADASFDLRNRKSYKLEDLSCHVFEKILDFIYTSELELSDDNIQELLQAADLLLLEDVKTMCCDYLEQRLTVNNCVGILQFTESFSCPRVYHLAQTFIDDHFTEVSFSEEFLQLEEDRLRLLLQRKSLMITTEDFMYQSLRRWLDYNPEKREDSFPDLLHACVNLALLDERFLHETVLQDPVVQKYELEEWILSKRISPHDQQLPQQRGFCNVIVVTGGEGPSLRDMDGVSIEIKQATRCITIPRKTENQSTSTAWLKLADMGTSRVGHGMVEAGGFLFAIGGRDDSGRLLNSGEKYDPMTNTWTAIPLMNHARVAFGLVNIDDKIYAIGGSNDMSDPLTSMEEYDIYTNTWRRLPDMNLKRAWSAFAVCNKKIYVIGGGIVGKLYEAVECYDPRSQCWATVAPLQERRFNAQAVGVGSRIFVFGGLRSLECPSALHPSFSASGMKFCATEIFDEEQKMWNLRPRDPGMCNMRESSSLDAALVCGDEILLVGSLDMGTNHYHCVRALNPMLNMWRCIVPNHPPRQRGMAAAVLRMPRALLLKNGAVSAPTST